MKTQDRTRTRSSLSSVATADDATESILKAALKMFGTTGFDGASISSVAKLSEVSTALIHYHFSSKAELWNKTVAYGMAQTLRELSLTPDEMMDLDPITALKFFIRRYINHFSKCPFLFSIIVKESEVGSPRFAHLQKYHLRRFYKPWTDAIKMVREAGQLRISATDDHIALIAVGACQHFITSRHRALPVYDVDPSDPELIRRHADLVIDIIVTGITRSA